MREDSRRGRGRKGVESSAVIQTFDSRDSITRSFRSEFDKNTPAAATQTGLPRAARGETSLRCSTAGAAATRGEIIATGADEDVEGEHGGDKPKLQHLELAAGAALLLRQEDDDESRDATPPRGCTRAASEVRIFRKGIGKNEREEKEGRKEGERKEKKICVYLLLASKLIAGVDGRWPRFSGDKRKKEKHSLSLCSLT